MYFDFIVATKKKKLLNCITLTVTCVKVNFSMDQWLIKVHFEILKAHIKKLIRQKRKYDDAFLHYGFTSIHNIGEENSSHNLYKTTKHETCQIKKTDL